MGGAGFGADDYDLPHDGTDPARGPSPQGDLTWTDPGDATVQYYQYQQKKATAAFGPWTRIPDSTATTTSYRFTGLDNDTTYSYRIRVGRGVGFGPVSDVVTATPRGVPPDAPVLTATPRNGGVTLSWPNPVDASLLRWEYQYKIGTGVYQPWQTAREVAGGATLQFPVGGLTNGTPHAFRIRAVNADGTATSNEARATPLFGVPAKPTGLTTRWTEETGGNFVRRRRVLEWDGVADPSILRYEFTTDKGRTWELLTSDGSAARGELPEDQFRSGYTFLIRAVNAAGPGPASDEADDEESRVPIRAYIQSALLEWDATTRKATLVWDRTALGPWRGGRADLRWWHIHFIERRRIIAFPVGTTRYEIPGTVDAGDLISVRIAGCNRSDECVVGIDRASGFGRVLRFEAGTPNTVPTGFSATPGDAQVTLAWDAPTESGITVPNLTNGQAHTFGIQAENGRGASPISEAVTATPRGGPPARPRGLSAAPGNAEATLTWDDPHDASITRYQVKQGTAAWADISGSGAGTTSHTVGTLTNGTAYTFQIRAVNDHDGDSTDDPGPASDAVTVTPGVPAAPASLTVAPGNEQATLTWSAPASNNGSAVTGYEYTSNADAATPAWTDVPDSGSGGANETQYTVTSLVNNTAYAFAVRAENANGQGAATPTLRAVPVHPDAPQRPAGLRAHPGHQRVRLAGSRPRNPNHPVTSYQYRQSTNGGTTWNPDWTAITGSGAATTEHVLTGLANGTTYTFELRALNGGTEGPSTRAQATPSRAAAEHMITPGSSGQLTYP